ncbi:MAG: hypothetical protein PHN45_03025 [Methylococcales bacterium]|nr:hypothetical protein [Methylococcales bacterium]MDD5753705.1 hypothetical protein [Methylococcales bacterium]
MDNDDNAEVNDTERDAAKPGVATIIVKELQLTLNDRIAKPVGLGNVNFGSQNNAHILFHYEPVTTILKMQLLFLDKLPDGYRQFVTIKDVAGKNVIQKTLTLQS